jgi:glycosyltransferase involved in cell wall biosynthesis
MDTAYLAFPYEFKLKDRLQLTNWTKYSVEKAAAVVAISRFTKKCIQESYGTSSRDVVVAYPAVHPLLKLNAVQQRHLLSELLIEGPYFLYLGTIQPRKRIQIIIEAFEMLCQQVLAEKKQYRSKHQTVRQLPQLVIAGKLGWLAEGVVERCHRSRFCKQILLTGFVTDEQKSALLTGASAVLMVGRHEGFGIPALEAMQAGTIPIVARTGSLPEVVGAAGLLVAADNPLQLANKCAQILRMSSRERKMLISKGKEQARQFSWQTSAEIILDALENVASSRPVST